MKKLYENILYKSVDFCSKKKTKIYLYLISFIESIFFPLPTDIFLFPFILANKKEYLKTLKSHQKMALEIFLAGILDSGGDWYSKKNYLKAKPGVQYQYANLNAALVAIILERATGIPFKEYTRSMIFEPLKMNSTSIFLQKSTVKPS